MDNSARNKLAASVAQQWPAAAAGRFAVEAALSGGLDSVVLLHLLNRLRQSTEMQLSAVHVHHGLSPLADDWADFCRTLCRRWDIPLRIERVQVALNGQGLEAAARTERYRCFAQSRATLVALAHHADDQTETFMLAALRGGGLRALAAMPHLRLLTPGIRLWRPLLSFSRNELLAYAQDCGLSWMEDDSNSNPALLRNWLRLHGLPAWYSRIPNLRRQLPATISHLQRDLALLEEYIAADKEQVYDTQGRFRISRWRTLTPLRREQQLYAFAQEHSLGTPSAVSIRNFASTLANSATTQAEWQLPQGKAIYYADTLLDANTLQHILKQVLSGSLRPQWQPAPFGLPRHLTDARHGYWRTAIPEDSLPLAGGGRKKIRRLLQEQHIPPFLRSSWPVWAEHHSNLCLAALHLPIRSALAVPGGFFSHLPELQHTLPDRSYSQKISSSG